MNAEVLKGILNAIDEISDRVEIASKECHNSKMWDESINENPSHWDDINEAVKAVKNKVLQANHGYIDGNPVLFHCVLDASRFGLTEEKAKDQDMFDEYAVVSNKGANAGILIYVKTDNGNWQVNTWSARFLVRVLLEDIGISIPNNTE